MLHRSKLTLFCLLTCSAIGGYAQSNNANNAIAYQAVSTDPTTTANKTILVKDGVTRKPVNTRAIYSEPVKSIISKDGKNTTLVGNSNYNAASNTSLGYTALLVNTSGLGNTAVGYAALQSNTSGNGNTAQGVFALQSNTSGGSNSANGFAALQKNTIGIDNTAQGYMAMQNNTEGVGNTATGVFSLQRNTIGLNNTCLLYTSHAADE